MSTEVDTLLTFFQNGFELTLWYSRIAQLGLIEMMGSKEPPNTLWIRHWYRPAWLDYSKTCAMLITIGAEMMRHFLTDGPVGG